ncbi:hypothetical protein ASZ90_016983 [hydrocarbon metagenome]|uniref:Uncharacterized protein n=1 Tax=hydrocarbon metagenome TaxID=938273 RepID=A0A0W8EB21_9ZZZZ
MRYKVKRNIAELLRGAGPGPLPDTLIQQLRECYMHGGAGERGMITRRLQAAGVSGRVLAYIRGRGPLPPPAPAE